MDIKLFFQAIIKFILGVLVIGLYCLYLQILFITGMDGYLWDFYLFQCLL